MTVSIEFKADISDVEKKAGEIPDIVDRNTRRSRATRKPWEGGGPGGGTKSDYDKLANAEQEIKREQERRAKEEAANQERQRKEADAEYRRKLKFNSDVLEEQQAEEAAAAKEAEKEKERQAKEEENRRKKEEREEERRRNKAEREAERAAKEEERRAKKKADELEKEKKREERRAANAKDWGDKFSDTVSNGLLRTIGPWAVAMKAFQVIVSATIDSINRVQSAGNLGTITKMNPQNLLDIETAARRVGSNPDEIGGMVSGLQNKLAKGALGVDAEGIRSISLLQSLGMDINFEKVKSGAVDASDAIKFLADKYGDLSQGTEGAMMMSQLFGEEYMKLIPIMRNGSKGIEDLGRMTTASQGEIQGGRDTSNWWGNFKEAVGNFGKKIWTGSSFQNAADLRNQFEKFGEENKNLGPAERMKKLYSTEQQGGLMKPGESSSEFKKRMDEALKLGVESYATGPSAKERQARATEYRRDLQFYGPDALKQQAQKSAGKPTEGIPSLAIANSLQAMGGGDFASTLNRGPVDRIADATEKTAEATKETANNTKSGEFKGKGPIQPAIIGR